MLTLITFLSNDEERTKLQQLMDQYGKLLYQVAFSIFHDQQAAEDALQEGYLKIWQSLHKINSISCPETRNFLVIIVKRTCLTILNRQDPTVELEEGVASSLNIERQAASDDLVRQVADIIHSLPEVYMDALYMKLILELPSKEIAKKLGMSVNTVEKRLQRGRLLLRERMMEEGIGYEE